VAGGLAAYFDIDSLLVRIGFVVLTIAAGGAGLLLYFACWLLIPREDEAGSAADRFIDRHGRTLGIVAGAFIALSLLTATGPFFWGDGNGPWLPLLIVGIVVIVLLLRNDRNEPARTTWTAGVPQPPGTPAGAQPSAVYPPHPMAPPYPPAPTYPPATYSGVTGSGWGWSATAPPTTPPPPPTAPDASATPPVPSTPRERSVLGLLTFGVALVVVGVLVALDRTDVLDVPVTAMLASALAVVGVGLVVGAVIGRARGLVALGVGLTLATAITASVNLPGNASIGEIEWRPTNVSEVATDYRWGVGEARLDLSGVDLTGTTTPVETTAELGIGVLIVTVPDDAVVQLDASVGAGEILLPGQSEGEGNAGITVESTEVLRPDGGAADAPVVLDLDVSIGLGNVEVRRA
jgi:phage shock protein PspC (stress-responsive transcriptional regulator)